MKALFISTALFLTALSVNAQNNIKGTVHTAEKAPVDFAEIYLIDTKGNLVQSAYTNEQGTFEIHDIANNTYSFQIHSLGVKAYDKNLEINKDLDLGVITIEQDTKLDEIVVETTKKVFERKVDRTVFNIESSVHATNNDAVDLLKLTPSLKVDNESITIVGKSSVRVMINDKLVQLSGEELLNYLKSIPSDNIKKIEVITTPPAKYEAEGNSGLINIVLKEAPAEAWNNQISAGYKQSSKNQFRLSNTFNYNKDKVSLIAGVSGTKGGLNVIEDNKIFYPTETWVGDSKRYNNNDYLSGNIQVDYKISDKTTIGGQYKGGIGDPTFDDYSNIVVNNSVNNPVKYIKTLSENTGNNNNQSANLNLTHNIDTLGTKFTADVDYFSYINNKERLFNTKTTAVDNSVNNMFIAKSTGDQKIENFSAKVDFEQPLKWAKLSYGAKASFVVTKNKTNFFNYTTGVPVEDLKQKDNFEYKENTQAVYVNASKEFNDKWTMQLGLRLENTQTVGTSQVYNIENKKNYTKLFPTVYVAYKMNEDNTFSINYNRRISRPAFWELNPFKWYINEYSIAQGNPSLAPAFTDKVELNYTYKGKLDFNVSYGETKDNFGQYPVVDPNTNYQNYYRDNFTNTKNYNAGVSYTFNTFPWLQSQSGLYYFYTQASLTKNVDIVIKDGGGAYLTTNNTFFLNSSKTWTAQLDFWYQTRVQSNAWDVDPTYGLNFGMKYAMLDKKLNLSVYANDIFRTSTTNVYAVTNGIKQNYFNYYDQRYVNVGISYSFGNSKIKVRDHQGGNTDEKNRK
ncbi:TonB-dependent receptor [Myroides marinus]|uniref:TonB-dependent receptor n=1 Tax=Myroides marinus TaxID=703342 RepID=A0A163W8T3_9FLAO|nr:outer membrane beta-barrel family protein [Myroides marinus]KZE76027.1 TonB-dependent receptor [Myroides marinus]